MNAALAIALTVYIIASYLYIHRALGALKKKATIEHGIILDGLVVFAPLTLIGFAANALIDAALARR